jgi:hypothetical protein
LIRRRFVVKNMIRRMAVAYILVGGWIAVATPVVLEARSCPPGTRCVGRDLWCANACTTTRDECCMAAGGCPESSPCYDEEEACLLTCCLSCEPI